MAYHAEAITTKRDYSALKRLGIIVSILMGVSIAGKNTLDCVARFYPPAQVIAPQEKSYFMTAQYDPETGTVEIQPPQEVGVVKSVANILGYGGNMLDDINNVPLTETTPQNPTTKTTIDYNVQNPTLRWLMNPFSSTSDSIDNKVDEKTTPSQIGTTGPVYNI